MDRIDTANAHVILLDGEKIPYDHLISDGDVYTGRLSGTGGDDGTGSDRCDAIESSSSCEI